MTRKEILALLEMSEKDQFDWLITTETIRFRRGKNGDIDWRESLADCAFRLRDKNEKTQKDKLKRADIAVVYKAVVHGVNTYKTGQSPAATILCWFWFATEAQPIHWIASALLANIDKESKQ